MSIIIDKEFESLIPPLSSEEFQQLEENCVKEGIRDALITWNGVLIDGHNRFKIAAKHGLPWDEKKMEFADRDSAKVWIINNQLGKRNLLTYDKVILEDKKRHILAEQAKAKRIEGNAKGGKSDKKSCPTPQDRKKKRENSTDYKIAKAAGTSEDTVRKVRAIEKSGDKEVIDKVRKQEISINQAYRSAMNIPPTPPKVDPTKEAEKRHEQFEQAKEEKMVSFNDARRDKDDVNTIARAMAAELESAMIKLLNIDRLGSVDVENILKVERTESAKSNFKRQVKDCIKLLVHLERILNDW